MSASVVGVNKRAAVFARRLRLRRTKKGHVRNSLARASRIDAARAAD